MQLEITKNNNGTYQIETEVNKDFNLHLERTKSGVLEMFQKTSQNGKYAVVDSFNFGDKTVVDYDFSAVVYPKTIKIVSLSEITYAEITYNE